MSDAESLPLEALSLSITGYIACSKCADEAGQSDLARLLAGLCAAGCRFHRLRPANMVSAASGQCCAY